MFETLRPTHKLLRKYVSYYYLDIADDEDYFNQYICYPHYNNTISLYRSHTASLQNNHSIISFEKEALPLQIFTPLRGNILKVTQQGPVCKIGIVFEPFGINQFLVKGTPIDQISCTPTFHFFEDEFVLALFDEHKFKDALALLESQLLLLLNPIENQYITNAIQIISLTETEMSIDELAEAKLGISRKHLNRLFKQHLGVSIQRYRSIVRFRQLMSYKLHQSQEHNLTTISHLAHYTNQSHFIKACKQLTGLTPSQFFKEGRIVGSEDTFWNFAK